MTVSLTHAFVSAIADDPSSAAAGEVLPQAHWNAQHSLTQATGKLLGRTTAGTGSTEEITPSSSLTLSGGTLDIANPSPTVRGGVKSLAAASHQFLTQIGTDGTPAQAQPAFSDLSGTISSAQLPASSLPLPTASTLGGVESYAAVTHQWINAISTSGVPSSTQPAFTDISGSATIAQLPNFTQTGTGAVARTYDSRLKDLLSIKDFGAVADGTTVSATCSITSGTNALTATGASFTANDVGKLIIVPGAGGAGGDLLTTISGFTSATQIALTANASTTLTTATKTLGYGTDNATFIANAYTQAVSSKYGLFYPAGNYFVSTSLNFSNSFVKHVSFGGVTITNAGGGTQVVLFDGGASSGNLYGVSFGSREFPFTLVGNSSVTYGAFARSCDHSQFYIIGRDVTGYGAIVIFGELSRFFVECSTNSGGAFRIAPVQAIGVTRRGVGENTSDCEFEIIAEGIAGTGISIDYTQQCVFTGTSEGNVSGGGGVNEGANCLRNVYFRVDCEANAGTDWSLNGSDSTLIECSGASTTGLVFSATAARYLVIKGVYTTVADNASSSHCRIEGAQANTFTVNSSSTTWRDVFNGSATFYVDHSTRPTITAPTLAGTWVNFGGAIRNSGYWQSAEGIVHLCGTVKSGTAGTTIFTLPAGMRPSGNLAFNFVDLGTPSQGYLQVASTGVVSHVSGAVTQVSLDGVSFLAEQ